MKFFSSVKKKKKKKKKDQTPVTVRVQPPGYSYHEFVLPASHLHSPHFASLMATAWEEYGVHRKVFAIPCDLGDFLNAMVDTDIGAPFKPRGAEAAPVDASPLPRRRTLGWFLARSH